MQGRGPRDLVQLVVGGVADEVGEEPTVGGPDRLVDPHGHGPKPRPGLREAPGLPLWTTPAGAPPPDLASNARGHRPVGLPIEE
ncbi:hypothetical protein GCM10009721_20570 [Terrabacter tumescens]|uniref:Uncharacterized protein n=1 Tax=Terrabacter tumescens TaxID=60443 RepID=A0ABQ2HY51_9MICO|nr:hypothetical protein GCM10009721_20570 [Terrabacter tumescens]